MTFYNRCSHIVSPSKSVRDNLVKEGLSKSTTCFQTNRANRLPAGIGDSRIRQSLGIDDFAFIYVGRISPEKSLDMLIDAFAQVTRVNPKAKLVIVGAGPSDPDIDKQLASLEIEDSVVLLSAELSGIF